MASRAGGVLQDQNLNIPFNEASFGRKTNVSKAPRKGGLGGRTPLGDLSNSLKPLNHAPKKQNSSIFTESGTGGSHIALDASKKCTSTASGKLKNGGRKALSDISNSGKSHPKEPSKKKNHNAKLSVVAEESMCPSDIAGEQFLHNHQECIKAQTRAMGMDQSLQMIGLYDGFPEKLATPPTHPKLGEVKAESTLRLLEVEDTIEYLPEDESWKYTPFSRLDSPSPSWTPITSPKYSMEWKDYDACIEFKLIESPELLKH